MDVLRAIVNFGPWDLIILHPPCTYLSLSGNRWYGKGTSKHFFREFTIEWTKNLWQCAKDNSRIGSAIENPTSVLWNYIGKPQYIQPWQFGHGEVKKTGILTHRLPPLIPTHVVEGREPRVWKMPPSEHRARDRSETYKGIAEAMAQQWGALCQVG